MNLDELIEGWVIRVSVGFADEVWVVRGYRHPTGSVIATPYIRGSRKLKPYDFSNIPVWLSRYVECIGRVAPVLSNHAVISVFDPRVALRIRRAELWPEVRELIEYMNPEWVGLTGSWAVFNERDYSDVDLLVYGNHAEMYKTLRDLKTEGLIEACRLEERFYKVGDKLSWADYSRLAYSKLLDSCFKSRPYTLRILRSIAREPCSDVLTPLGYYTGVFEIVDASESYLTPARYIAEANNRRFIVETWHTRYSELPLGTYKGKLRLVASREGVIASPDIDGWVSMVD